MADDAFPRLRRTAFVLLCLVPFLLVVFRAGADAIFCIIGLLFLARSHLAGDWGWTKRAEIRALFALWGVMLISSALSENPPDALGKAAAWVRFILFYAAATSWLLTNARALKIVCYLVLPFLIFLALDTTWQYLTGVSLTGYGYAHEHRLGGLLNKPNIGNYFLKIGFSSLGLIAYALIAAGKSRRVWWVGFLALWLVALVMLSGERSITLLTFFGIGCTGLLLFVFHSASRKYVVPAVVVLAAQVAILALTQPIVQQRGQIFFKQLSHFWESPYGQLYANAFSMWQQHPLLGVGVGQFRYLCEPNMQALGLTFCDVHPHNIYMEWLSSTGVVGVLLFGLAMALIVYRIIRTYSLRGETGIPTAFALGNMAVLMFPLIVTQSAFSNWPAMLFWYSLSLATCLPRIAKT